MFIKNHLDKMTIIIKCRNLSSFSIIQCNPSMGDWKLPPPKLRTGINFTQDAVVEELMLEFLGAGPINSDEDVSHNHG
jgi:hypothetical protein